MYLYVSESARNLPNDKLTEVVEGPVMVLRVADKTGTIEPKEPFSR